jgi:hypothetical protein
MTKNENKIEIHFPKPNKSLSTKELKLGQQMIEESKEKNSEYFNAIMEILKTLPKEKIDTLIHSY